MTMSPLIRAATWVLVLFAVVIPVTAEESTSTPPPVTKWEYKFLRSLAREDVAAHLNKHGAEGWECVSAGFDGSLIEVILKRPLAAGAKAATVEPRPAPAPAAEKKPVSEKAMLVALAEQIVAKEMELASLKRTAAVLRQKIAASEKPKDGKVYRSAAELLADMPKEAYPKGGSDGGIERAKADKWCEANLIGRVVEWTATVKKVTIEGDEPFRVELHLAPVSKDDKVDARAFHDGVSLGDQLCRVAISTRDELMSVSAPGEKGQRYWGCSAAEADSIRKMKGKVVTLRATIRAVGVDGRSDNEVRIWTQTSVPSLDGFIPESTRAKQETEAR